MAGIGGLTVSDLKSGDQPNYQDSVTLPTSRSEDANAVLCEDDEDPIPQKDAALLSAFEKVSQLIYYL